LGGINRQHVGFGDGGRAVNLDVGQRTGGIIGEKRLDYKSTFVGIGMAAGNREGSTRGAADRAGRGGAIAPIDRGSEVACDLAGITRVGEGRYRAAERYLFSGGDGLSDEIPEIALGDGGGAAGGAGVAVAAVAFCD